MSPKIMLIDDEKGIVAVMKNYFEMSGYQVVTAYRIRYNKLRKLKKAQKRDMVCGSLVE